MEVHSSLLGLSFKEWAEQPLSDSVFRGKGIQDTHSPKSICFGCGPSNEKGLHIQSFENGDEMVAVWKPEAHHQAFPGVLNGGIVGSLLDCHSNWTAAWKLMKESGQDHPPCTVTADYAIQLKRPTPVDRPIYLRARVRESSVDRALIEAILVCDGKVCATCTGTFVAVQPGHPAYHRW
jgi:acyl-coenzyme A thioesterase PaaI-like protein